jgi:putative salt-induced outer membrane protein YdiY
MSERRAHIVAGAIRVVAALVVVSIGILSPVDLAHAQDDAEKELGWSFVADLAAVWTGGNSESGTYGLDAVLRRAMTRSALLFQAGGTQTESSLKTRTAVGTSPDDFMLHVDKRTEKTAELFYARARYDYNISKRFYLLTGVDWLRNTFAGIDSRTLVGLGAGNTWSDNEKVRFMTNYAFTYTFQAEVVQNPFTKNEFPGVRLAYNLWWKLTTSTEFLNTVAVDWNLDNTDDVRVDFTSALPVSISEKLELKPSLQLLWRNDPALTEVGLYATDGTPTGDTVLVPLEELDTFFTLALVVKI